MKKEENIAGEGLSKSVTRHSMAESRLQGMTKSYAYLYFSYAVIADSGYFKNIHLSHTNTVTERV